VTDSKSVVPERVPGVRIPPSPPLGAAQDFTQRSRKRDENFFDERSNRDWRWGTEGDRFAMRRSLTNPSLPPFKGYMRVLNLCQLVRDGDTKCDILAHKCNFKWASYFMDNLIYNSIRTTYV
jgi:hypothetical protein